MRGVIPPVAHFSSEEAATSAVPEYATEYHKLWVTQSRADGSIKRKLTSSCSDVRCRSILTSLIRASYSVPKIKIIKLFAEYTYLPYLQITISSRSSLTQTCSKFLVRFANIFTFVIIWCPGGAFKDQDVSNYNIARCSVWV